MKYQITIQDRIFEVEIQDLHARPIIALVNGERFEVWPQDGNPALSAPPTLPTTPGQKTSDTGMTRLSHSSMTASMNTVLAPIPGIIVSIAVQPGDTVSFGQELCVLEAMKMKNAIRATRSGQIASILVSVGQQVKHHDILMEYVE